MRERLRSENREEEGQKETVLGSTPAKLYRMEWASLLTTPCSVIPERPFCGAKDLAFVFGVDVGVRPAAKTKSNSNTTRKVLRAKGKRAKDDNGREFIASYS